MFSPFSLGNMIFGLNYSFKYVKKIKLRLEFDKISYYGRLKQ